MIFVLVMAAFILSIGYIYVVYQIYKENDESRKETDFDAKWLEEQKNDKYRITFILDNDVTLYTKFYEPEAFSDYSFSVRLTSEARATSSLIKAYEYGYFTDSDNNTYPACKIKKAYVEKVKETL